jgi:hypothetical protein
MGKKGGRVVLEKMTVVETTQGRQLGEHGPSGDTNLTSNIENLTGLPGSEDLDGDEESFGFGSPTTERADTARNVLEVSMESEDPPMEISTLRAELEKDLDIVGGGSTSGSDEVNYEEPKRTPQIHLQALYETMIGDMSRLENGSGGSRKMDPPARISENRLRRQRSHGKVRNVLASGGDEDSVGEDSSTSSSGSELPKPEKVTPTVTPTHRFSAPWNKKDFIYRLLYWTMEFPDELMTILQDRMFIANTESFLEFFKASPDQFLVQLPLPLEKIQEFKVYWMKASMVANFFIHQVHPGEQIQDFARLYDAEDPPISNITQHVEVYRGLGQYLHQFEEIAQVEFQRCHQKAMAALVGQGPRLTAKFNASIGRPIPTTPPPVPTDVFDGYRSPIVEPMGGHGKFMNRPPYARAGTTYETPREAVGAPGLSSFQSRMYPPPYFASAGTP